MSKKILISIIAVLLFLVAVNFYTKDEGDKQHEERVAEIENLKQENAKLKQNNDKLKVEIQELETSAIMNVAKQFKTKEYSINYDGNYEFEGFKEQEEATQKKFGDYATKNELMHLSMTGIVGYIQQLSQETKSNLSMKDISIESADIETEAEEVNLDYDIEIEFDPVKQEGEKKSISNFGQMRVIKTEEGWKVDADLQQMKGFEEVIELLSKQSS